MVVSVWLPPPLACVSSTPLVWTAVHSYTPTIATLGPVLYYSHFSIPGTSAQIFTFNFTSNSWSLHTFSFFCMCSIYAMHFTATAPLRLKILCLPVNILQKAFHLCRLNAGIGQAEAMLFLYFITNLRMTFILAVIKILQNMINGYCPSPWHHELLALLSQYLSRQEMNWRGPKVPEKWNLLDVMLLLHIWGEWVEEIWNISATLPHWLITGMLPLKWLSPFITL